MSKDTNAEVLYNSGITEEELKEMEPISRETIILEIKAIERLTPQEDGVELNEGYSYSVNGAIPQLADGIAKMIIEMDKHVELGENAGTVFLSLIMEYHGRLKENTEGGI